ncbi:MAG: NAD(P)-dependent oxidoreductase [Paracoccaceae bacterium]|nr:NAD(P)-dependent oxidoreductase [Paracoccaceae bacterium]
MASGELLQGVVAGRLSQDEYVENFSDLHEPLNSHEALVAADRCYFCYDAPCVTSCPTDIDIPLFIRQIATGTADAAGMTIFSQNILGGMCARVCPTETLCEETCVREVAEGKPVQIGQLQRFATDRLMAHKVHPFVRAAETGRRIVVIGAGPAGLACAHRLALHGHSVVIYDANAKAGGLNEYGIASYKTVDSFAKREVAWLLEIGGITIEHDKKLGRDLSMTDLRKGFDASFLAIGLAGVNALGASKQGKAGVRDAVDFISELRQAESYAQVSIGRDVVVIGGGMTAVDAAVQARLLGALNVTLVYRRSRERMNASRFEQDLAAAKGVRIITNAAPVEILGNGAVEAVSFEYMDDDLNPMGEVFTLTADQVLTAIGQTLGATDLPSLSSGRIAVSPDGRTSVENVWAGGDCTNLGDDLTVTAVAQGRDAAEDIHCALCI